MEKSVNENKCRNNNGKTSLLIRRCFLIKKAEQQISTNCYDNNIDNERKHLYTTL